MTPSPTVDVVELLLPRFRDALGRAFGPEHENADPMLRRSDRADLQANVALGLGKKLGKPPRAVAEALVAALSVDDVLEKVEIAGPGFLNLTVRPEWLSSALGRARDDAKLGVGPAAKPDTVVIDYSAPNVAKEMHVGHLRSTVIGDALARLLEWRGHSVIRQNHIGDWGTPFGMLIEHLIDVGEAATKSDVSVGELGAFYKQARGKFDSDPAFADRARKRVVLLQSGDHETLRLWRVLFEASKGYFEKVYALLDVTLTSKDLCGESFYDPMLAPLCDELEKRGVAKIDQGALCIFPPGFTTKEGTPLPLIIRKQDGGFGYATTDLAAVRYRVEKLNGTRLLYVVGSPQAQHLAMVFASAKICGFLPDTVKAEHVAFGSVLGTDKRMFRSRSGETARLVDLIEAAIDRAAVVVKEKAPDLSDEERSTIARAVGVGSIKYADLSSDRIKDYVFDIERMVSFEGNTAGYLQYAVARANSIHRKAGEVAIVDFAVKEPAEKALALALLDFGSAVREVESTLQPHRLAGYLYSLAVRFTEFWDACPVLKADEPIRSARVGLVDLTARTLSEGLSLLGIKALERM